MPPPCNNGSNTQHLIDKEKEWSLPASYYILFAQHEQLISTRDATKNTVITATAADDDAPVWEDDEWTAADEQQALQLIQDNWDKSSLSSYPNHHNNRKEEENASAWDRFYACHQSHFFKDRHYLAKEYPHEFGRMNGNATTPRTWVEVGCGVGNAIWPWISTITASDDDPPQLEQQWNVVHALDISPKAIELFCQDERFIQWNEIHAIASASSLAQEQPTPLRSIHGHVCDISQSLPDVCRGVADVTTLLFCLSAIPEDHTTDNDDNKKKQQACLHAAATLKPGGVLILRDYGRYDAAHLKLAQSRQKRMSSSMEYRKSDGTHCYYLTTDEIRDWMVTICHLDVLELDYVRRVYYSRKKDDGEDNGSSSTTTTRRRRVWVHGRFQKPFV